ncbi:AI-2E family transporter [Magnetofaba australis]|uniref:Permease n=1 Tax=Magnetofaba australis IT-1 TaxID=1434232 RepID=A0A1Y2K7U9_9PROT|nr:AI-2E family transporter [Magnetofaba australis]OSM06133.1 hypothetical protein MAIT1_01093 [Magnetofaba australis IT-1]
MTHPFPHRAAFYQESFVLILVLLAVAGLLWLFSPFAPGLFLAGLLATATYPLYWRLQNSPRLTGDAASAIMSVAVVLIVVGPLLYLLIASGVMVARLAAEGQAFLATMGDSPEQIRAALMAKVHALPLPDDQVDALMAWLMENRQELAARLAKGALFLFRAVGDNGAAFLSSLLLTAFALFFFYRDGPAMARRFMHLTPLQNCYDTIIMRRFAALSSVLTLSTVGIAFIQGVSFGLAALFWDLPWFYLGLAMAVAAFIPVVGGFVVWAPVSWHLYAQDQVGGAFFMAFWGAIIGGVVIDNLLRPMLMSRLGALYPAAQEDGDLNILDHTLLTVLATFGGLIHFGILGLLFGPLLAAMAITIFDLYEMIHGDWLEQEDEIDAPEPSSSDQQPAQ